MKITDCLVPALTTSHLTHYIPRSHSRTVVFFAIFSPEYFIETEILNYMERKIYIVSGVDAPSNRHVHDGRKRI